MSPASPQLKPLSLSNRRHVFLTMVGLFTILVPVLVLYATGYRFDWTNVENTFRVVGGMYITNSAENTNIVVNGEPVQNMRIFQQAAYIQNVTAGLHEVYVEGEGLHTWVKELPVFAQLVTEARSFNIPVVPRARVITKWLDPQTSAGILFEPATTTPFKMASTSNLLIATTSKATSTYVSNSEYTYVKNLFASSTTAVNSVPRVGEVVAERFTFDRTATSATSTATTTRLTTNVRLYGVGGEVYVDWVGEERSIPYYYCVNYQGATSTTLLYGEHVYQQLYTQLGDTLNLADKSLISQTLCRHSIRIDRAGSSVHWFDFVPGTTDLILMHLNDGLYVVEVDDRAWQNMQLLYSGEDIRVVVDGRDVYVEDGEYYLEVSANLMR